MTTLGKIFPSIYNVSFYRHTLQVGAVGLYVAILMLIFGSISRDYTSESSMAAQKLAAVGERLKRVASSGEVINEKGVVDEQALSRHIENWIQEQNALSDASSDSGEEIAGSFARGGDSASVQTGQEVQDGVLRISRSQIRRIKNGIQERDKGKVLEVTRRVLERASGVGRINSIAVEP
jgi:hypothetical protein